MKKSVLITGGSRGIGAAAVRKFIEQGYETAFFYRESDEAAKALQEETGAAAIRCDVGDRWQIGEGVKAAKTCLGITAFDTLVCNAGLSVSGLFTDLSDEDWSRLLNVNLNGIVNVTKEILPAMVSERKGQIVMVSSMWGQTGASCEAAYAATKAAVIGLAKSLAKEVGPSGIRVNTVSPGVIDTDMNRCYSAETMGQLAEEVPLGRIGSAEEVAKAIYFLASEEASYITGQVLGVNGGFYI
ncbi:elongation factor P 5-aminopentanone reductase [Emergencia timonensis]|uniref:elongation factor P 5-aminopentanone reductase n=1 Tax=Emergencia timonensis TaxID=1776384 RepID=UPI0039944D70